MGLRDDDDRTDALVDLARAGDASSYNRLFARVADRALLYIRLRLGPALRAKVDPLDVLQETYLEAHRSFAHFRPQAEGAFLRWLYGIADNRLRNLADHWRAGKRAAARETPGVIERLRASQTGPATACGRAEQNDRLLAALESLGADEREALVLRYFHESTLEAIALAMDTSISSARRLLARAELRLGRALGPAR